MESPKIVYRYYSNPAFCAQSEVVFTSKTPCVSPRIVPSVTPDRQRIRPLGASPRKTPEKNTPTTRRPERLPKSLERTLQRSSNHRIRTDISDNPLRIQKFGAMLSNDDTPPALPPKPAKFQHLRSNSTSSHLQRQLSLVRPSKRCTSANSSIRSRTRSEDLELSDMNHEKHRYEIIPDDIEDLIDYSPTKKRVVVSETNEYNVDHPDESEMKAVPTEIVKTVNGKTHRYAIIPTDDDEPPKRPIVTFSSPPMSKKNLIATQKLHELLSTPRRSNLKSYLSQPSIQMLENINYVRNGPSSLIVTPMTPNCTPSKTSTPNRSLSTSRSCANLASPPRMISPISPRAQQNLEYKLSLETSPKRITEIFQRERSFEMDRRRENGSRRDIKKSDRTTAIITPRVASPPPSTYSEDTYKSWSIASKVAPSATLAVAALMMTLCGALTAGLSFYMMNTFGRHYYLDFGVLSGFTCLLLGMLGFRSRRYQLLPNRNYVSGYIILSVFSLLSCACLLVILTAKPHPGTPLHDVTSGAVCGLSALSLALASLGVVTSYCCRQPPPDNRVAHERARWY